MNVKYLKVIIFGLAMGFWVYTKLQYCVKLTFNRL